jgi:translation initiation factor 2 beta subunit (eIF-2beta)/eIF-5
MAVKHIIWFREMLKEVGLEQKDPTVLRGDNQTMVQQTEVSMNHERSRHYRIAQAFIRSAVEERIVKVVHDRSDNLEADVNTKILGKVKFVKFFNRILGTPQFIDRY